MLLNDMTKRLLTQHGYCATSAYSGSEALLLIERSSFVMSLSNISSSIIKILYSFFIFSSPVMWFPRSFRNQPDTGHFYSTENTILRAIIVYQKERRRIGFVPQKLVTIGSLSPADMLRYFSSVFGTTEIHVLDILHLNLKEKKAVRRLPLSTQRLVNLAVALLGNPDMIILDDPFSGLDKGECEHLLSVLNYLHEINHTTLLISGQDYTLLSRRDGRHTVHRFLRVLPETRYF